MGRESGRRATLSERLPAIVVWVAALGYALLATYLSIRRHDAFLSGYDLANFDQDLWLLANGHEPLNTQTGRVFWGQHFSPTIVLLTPLYVFGAGITGLLTAQALTMAAVAPLLFALARSYGARPWLAAVPALLWLASPLTLLPNLFDVHHVPLVAPLVVGSILALRYDRLVVFGVLALLASGAKEDVSLIYVMVGVVLVLEGRRRLGAAIGAASLALFVFAVAVFMPAFGDSASWFANRFAGDRGDSLADVLVWMTSNPIDAVGDLVSAQNVVACLVLVLMTGGLCLLAARWMLLGLPVLAHNLLSAYDPQHELGYHYFVPVSLAFSIAAAIGVHRLPELRPRARLAFTAAVATAIGSFFIGLLAALPSTDLESAPRAKEGGVSARREAVALVPRDAVVAASPRLSTRLSQRRELYALPLPFLGREEFGTDFTDEEMERRAQRVEWIVIDTDDAPIEFPETAERIQGLVPGLGFREVYRRGSVVVYTRDTAGA